MLALLSVSSTLAVPAGFDIQNIASIPLTPLSFWQAHTAAAAPLVAHTLKAHADALTAVASHPAAALVAPIYHAHAAALTAAIPPSHPVAPVVEPPTPQMPAQAPGPFQMFWSANGAGTNGLSQFFWMHVFHNAWMFYQIHFWGMIQAWPHIMAYWQQVGAYWQKAMTEGHATYMKSIAGWTEAHAKSIAGWTEAHAKWVASLPKPAPMAFNPLFPFAPVASTTKASSEAAPADSAAPAAAAQAAPAVVNLVEKKHLDYL